MFINILSVILLSAIPIQSFANVNSATDAVFTKHEKVALEASGMIATSNGFGTGTCFEYKNRKIILTAKHVIKENADNNEKIYFLQNNKTIELSPLKMYENIDLATLDIKADAEDVKCNSFTPLKSIPKVFGESVFYVGYPNGVGPVRISGEIANYFIEEDMYIMQSFAWPGASGSAVYDRKGKIIGVVSAVQTAIFNPSILLENIVYVTSIRNIFDDQDPKLK
jgi:S1-C subfamily serine protease